LNKLGKFSFGIGDRFARQGVWQLKAFEEAKSRGVTITPVWNKSFREHKTVDSDPASVRLEADAAVKELGWNESFLVDADHITMETVDGFLASSDFFTIDVANKIGKAPDNDANKEFLSKASDIVGAVAVPGLDPFEIDKAFIEKCSQKFLLACQETKKIQDHILEEKSGAAIEVSMDEVEEPQTPEELLVLFKMFSIYDIRPDTIAPKFTGRFNKGVDYEGDTSKFKKEFEADLLIIRYAIENFGLPQNLKLSVHTGSDKFQLYPVIKELITKYQAGLHLKTAGTTWLEEVIGLAESGGEALNLAKDIYKTAYGRYEELTGPYSTVLNFDFSQLPTPDKVEEWDSSSFVDSLRHDQTNKRYNPHFRQLIHTAYKVAAEMGDKYLVQLDKNQEIVGRNVLDNIWHRHIKPLFII